MLNFYLLILTRTVSFHAFFPSPCSFINFQGNKVLEKYEFEKLFQVNSNSDKRTVIIDLLKKISHNSSPEVKLLKQNFMKSSTLDSSSTLTTKIEPFQILQIENSIQSNQQKQQNKIIENSLFQQERTTKTDFIQNERSFFRNTDFILNSINNFYKFLVIFLIIFSASIILFLSIFFYLSFCSHKCKYNNTSNV